MSVIATMMKWNLNVKPSPVPVQSVIAWDEESPLEIRLSFDVGLPDPVEWVFARDILLDALQENQAGSADVQCTVKDDLMSLTIDSPFGSAQFTIDSSIVGQYLARIYAKVPRGEESYDLDAVVAQFFAEPA